MQTYQKQTVTVLFYQDNSLKLHHQICQFMKKESGRVVIPATYKKGKSIIAVIEGAPTIANLLGERAMDTRHLAFAS